MLKIEHLSKSYDPTKPPILNDFNLDVGPGEFVSLLGPSGCGKTTALRIVTGLLEASGGEVFMDGQPSTGPSREKAIVFQGFNLFPWRTALSNAAYGLELQGVKKKARTAVAAEYLQLVGLGDRMAHYPSQLSGGQQQRVGLARALAIKPKLLLMDEPFGALDALTREQLQGMLMRICADHGLSVLFVTHSIDEAIYLSDRIVVMGVNPGRVLRTFDVGLRKPRYEYDWRGEAEYVRLRAEIWALLQSQIAPVEAAA
ncbi:ABC transporter ATP-binding protein [Dactylosporangium sp. NPDC005572]|uniref:ABC transporter ATP-binding protein n=1 Tax=Dactylosporangium sp. NPDC005572 TaxID=3156889 RepID=UPI0033A1DE40